MARTTTVHLVQGDYADRLQALWEAANAAANDKTPATALEGDPVAALEATYKALKAEALEAATTVVLTAVGRKVWRELKAKHPMRVDDPDPEIVKEDRVAGVNADSVEDDLVYASLTSPEFSSRAAFDEWADSLSEGEWQSIVTRAWELANGARLDPKELPFSLTRSDA